MLVCGTQHHEYRGYIVYNLRNPHQIMTFKHLTSWGQVCPTQSGSLNFRPVWNSKLPDWVGHFCPTQSGSLNFLTGWGYFHRGGATY